MAQNLPEAYKQKIKDGLLKPDSAQERAVAMLQKIYEGLENKPKKSWKILKKREEAPKGLYIYGGTGRGKSMLMDMFFGLLPEDVKKRRVHFHQFMIEVHDYIHTRREDDDFDDGIDGVLPALASRIAERSRVLCFDEFHVTDVADAMILGRLFTALFEKRVVIIATSNWPPDDLYKGGLQRDRFLPFIDLLKQKMDVLHLDGGTDYRTQFLQNEGTYFWPLGEGVTRKADEVFAMLTDGAEPAEEKIKVKGRTIVAHAAKGVARFTFSQLCENPHGAEDYIKIAESYPTVILENIPKLGYDRRNEAKRLMTLIDALYEARTRLIITADAPPDKLYRGHDHEFEFQRTVSRLLEMQGEGYLVNKGQVV
ncbi:MAG: AFG1 family ATPase [Alphaproteobacteria bacterium]|nr:AFG1 family ATPase [Alphaproteobacteria bacterium]